MEQFNKTVCDHLGKNTSWGPTIVEIAGTSFAAFALLVIGHFA